MALKLAIYNMNVDYIDMNPFTAKNIVLVPIKIIFSPFVLVHYVLVLLSMILSGKVIFDFARELNIKIIFINIILKVILYTIATILFMFWYSFGIGIVFLSYIIFPFFFLYVKLSKDKLEKRDKLSFLDHM